MDFNNVMEHLFQMIFTTLIIVRTRLLQTAVKQSASSYHCSLGHLINRLTLGFKLILYFEKK